MTVATPLRPYSPKSLAAMIGAPLLTIGTLAAVVLAPAVSAQSTTAVNCSLGDSLSTAVAEAEPGTTIEVSSTCGESVHVPRTVHNLVIDGSGNATVQGPDASAPPTGPGSFTFFIEGQGITLQGLTINGGAHNGVHLSGPASATIVGNTITGTGGAIHLDKDSTAQIAGNTITDNLGYGINIQENSYSRIGFTAPTRGLNGNTITDNDGPGIVIKQWSTGWISGNTIADNQGDGVVIDRNSLGEVYDNTIEANTGDGIRVSNGSGLSLTPEGAEAPSQVAGNHTAPATLNGGTGISCTVGGYVSGATGTINGTGGTTYFTEGCVNSLTSASDIPGNGNQASSLFQLSS
ncbi:right-handed parallel beta-helix repeat-containing protein [Corynebacterium halotolerans]|uniref:Parallel beta-helix repeat-containing protein n=1 Tax=Corynebacterium halotolerans YIM 70093 = DSM 44683 TaxID=1121362 RepID=M1NL95_9CORY|nr:right-handed parallel beta-helix repeat-containing protein [Corynebacterium halotolerans]AGF72178.1 parallel beta-helix repeat-containing protein [Corynebacterium halotolerans YIM 70093 = DSM 44683]